MESVVLEGISEPAFIIQKKGEEVELEMYGERFWLPVYLIKELSQK